MNVVQYTLSGSTIALHIRRTAKKNIIIRAHRSGGLQLSIPPWLTGKQLTEWLDAHTSLLQKALSRAHFPDTKTLPEHIWFMGRHCRIAVHFEPDLFFDAAATTFRLPEPYDTAQQRLLLRSYLFQEAAAVLLPKLAAHSRELQLYPAKTALSRAGSFWGVCRSTGGIRLNWRLIGAPEYVQDYVCRHELCHLVHPNHSTGFWKMLRRCTPYTDSAAAWLKAHGKELFLLD